MLKKIAEPQARYEKEPVDGVGATPPIKTSAAPAHHSVPSAHANSAQSMNKATSKAPTGKVIGGIVAFAMIVVVAIAGIMIAQRQQQVEGPVAPTAPESRPSAQEVDDEAQPDQCSLWFSVAEEVEEGSAICASKTAWNEDGVQIATGSAIRRGDVIEYSITVEADKQTTGPVTVKDVLPVGMTYVANSTSEPTSTTYVEATRTLTFELGTMGTDDTNRSITITYEAELDEESTVTSITNAAQVITAGETDVTDSCSVALTVAPEGVAVCEAKEALTDYTGRILTSTDRLKPGDTVAYRITVQADETTDGDVVIRDVLPNSLEFVETRTDGATYTAANRTISLDLGTLLASGSATTKTLEYKAKVASSFTSGTITNTARITTGTATPVSCSTSLTVAQLSCNSSCTTNAECTAVNADYTCAQTSDGRRCRLASNVSSTSCEKPDATPTPTPSPTPTPTIGCNKLCETNADCSNASHICFQTADGSKRCRLDTNVASESCTMPQTSTPAPQQPALPDELPQSGPDDWMNWLKAGLITLGVGALLLLLL